MGSASVHKRGTNLQFLYKLIGPNATQISGVAGPKDPLAKKPALNECFCMSTAEKIAASVGSLAPDKQAEVLEFVEFLKTREEKKELKDFAAFSLEGAMRGMEEEEDLYGPEDIIEQAG